jgi:C4-dicarboxylate-specific signal transduction histidine kinase
MDYHETDKAAGDDRLIQILEKQKQDLVIRFLQKHEEAETNRSFIDKIMSNLSDLIIVLSKDLEIVQASRELYHVLEYAENEAGLNLRTIAGDKNCQLLVDRLAAGEFRDMETRLVSRSGKTVPVIVRGSTYVTETGRVLHMLIASDRRDFYEVMGRMREVQDQLIHSGRLASLGEMAAGIGHELTQPLNTVLLLARNCAKAMDDPLKNAGMIRENLGTIVDRVNHASTIIRSLKGFASKAREEAVPVRVNVILLDILNFLDAQLLLSGVSVDLAIDENISWVLGQEVRIEQVLLNLIQNAIQAMAATKKPRLGIVTFKYTGVDPQSLQPRAYVGISITDNGDGIDPEILSKIFDPFFTTREVGTGMGLGLSIVDRIVRGFGGHIKVQSIPGTATTFTVYLPEFSAL